MSKFHQGFYRPKNPEKYSNPRRIKEIVFRSSWERSLMIWLDNNDDVLMWGSEEIVIPYISKFDGKPHRYYADFNIVFKNGAKLLVEVKPKAQTKEPVKTEKKTKKRYLYEAKTYAVNTSKWDAAKIVAERRGAVFVIWTEEELQKLGIKLQVSQRFRHVQYGKNKKQIKRLKPITTMKRNGN
jgi:hypothetical protein